MIVQTINVFEWYREGAYLQWKPYIKDQPRLSIPAIKEGGYDFNRLEFNKSLNGDFHFEQKTIFFEFCIGSRAKFKDELVKYEYFSFLYVDEPCLQPILMRYVKKSHADESYKPVKHASKRINIPTYVNENDHFIFFCNKMHDFQARLLMRTR
ncbi:hypothetical protein CDIK_1237 [Cucumispora dikerogammari]|nr:hypothetical protein CDIK_1237 [Cucumispora dikerogammari]